MEEKYLDVLSKNILNEVKDNIKRNNIYLEKEKESEIDKKMLEIIKSIVLNDKENIFEKNEDEEDKKKEINANIMPSLMQYYMAIYNDNLDLLHKLLDEQFHFGNYKYSEMDLFVLDKKISSKFESDEYIKLLKKNLELFKGFYYSLKRHKDNKEIDLNQIIDKFSNIIKKDNDIAVSKEAYKNRCDRLLTVDLLTNFTEDEILNLNDNQKDILNGFEDRQDKETKLILNLIKKHNYSKHLIFWSRFSKFFTEEEILNLSNEDINLIKNLFTCNYEYDDPNELEEIAVNKFKQIKKINPDFNINLDCFAYSALSIDQLMAMTESCAERINIMCSNWKFYHIKNDFNMEISEKRLKGWIKEAYCKDTIKRNVKKLVKIK